jgi:4-amino-4-deoxy-L-arabinose transferase-like glycosyltransferase
VLLPQAVEGALCVWLMHRLARPRFGAAVALISAALVAISPIVVAMNRTNNMDSALLLALMAAAAVLLRATETGSIWRLCAAMALIGVAFNVKMLAAFVVLPAFCAAWLAAAPVPFARRVAAFAFASACTAASSVEWIAFYDATPPGERPYAGSSHDNSMRELALGHNAASRFSKTAAPRGLAEPATEETPSVVAQRRIFVSAPAGPLRLLAGRIAAQFAWLLPLAVFGAAVAVRRERLASPWTPAAASLIFWGSWIASCALVYSAAGGIFHYYYVAPLVPALSLAAAIGIVEAFRAMRETPARRVGACIAIVATALWQVYVHVDGLGWSLARIVDLADWRGPLALTAFGVACIGAVGALAVDKIRTIALCGAITALLILPLAWMASAIVAPIPGTLPSADLYRLDPRVQAPPRNDVAALVEWLDRRQRGERFLLATTTTRFAAPVIIESGRPVMAMGGFHGLDRAMTPGELARRVASNDVRFVLIGDPAPPSRRLGADAALEPLTTWIRANGRRVESRQWRTGLRARGLELYDLRPAS